MKLDKKSLLLYAVTDRSWTENASLYEQVEQTLKGGTTFVQLREKDLSYEDFFQEGKEIHCKDKTSSRNAHHCKQCDKWCVVTCLW